MADSQTKTGEQTIKAVNKEVLMEFYSASDITEDYKAIRERLRDSTISNKDFVALLSLVWNFTVEKPKTSSEVKVNNGLNALSPEELKEIAEKIRLNDKR